MIDRRTFIAGATASLGTTVLPRSGLLAKYPVQLPVSELDHIVASGDARLVLQSDSQKSYLPYNSRTAEVPAVRILPRTAAAVTEILSWLRRNEIPFAVSGGGHSFEGLSQSDSVIVDLRDLSQVKLNRGAASVTVGGGVRLRDIERVIGPAGYGLSGGSCQTVGIAGLVLGGGYGLFSRAWGMTCDQLLSLDLALADGRSVVADARRHQDLYWASRGGGGCTFGVALALTFKLERLRLLRTISVDWVLSRRRAVRVLRAWQDWAPEAPETLTCIMRIERRKGGRIALKLRGHGLGSRRQAEREIRNLTRVEASSSGVRMRRRSYPGFTAPGIHTNMKGKSSYVFTPLRDRGFDELVQGIQTFSPGAATAILDPYGGAIRRIAPEATAFVHRAALFSIQYYTGGRVDENTGRTKRRIKALEAVHATMQSHVGPGAYVNYVDLDLSHWASEYWGNNLARLQKVKSIYDPGNFFRTAQSVVPAT